MFLYGIVFPTVVAEYQHLTLKFLSYFGVFQIFSFLFHDPPHLGMDPAYLIYRAVPDNNVAGTRPFRVKGFSGLHKGFLKMIRGVSQNGFWTMSPWRACWLVGCIYCTPASPNMVVQPKLPVSIAPFLLKNFLGLLFKGPIWHPSPSNQPGS